MKYCPNCDCAHCQAKREKEREKNEINDLLEEINWNMSAAEAAVEIKEFIENTGVCWEGIKEAISSFFSESDYNAIIWEYDAL
jgi:hypothetical protein